MLLANSLHSSYLLHQCDQLEFPRIYAYAVLRNIRITQSIPGCECGAYIADDVESNVCIRSNLAKWNPAAKDAVVMRLNHVLLLLTLMCEYHLCTSCKGHRPPMLLYILSYFAKNWWPPNEGWLLKGIKTIRKYPITDVCQVLNCKAGVMKLIRFPFAEMLLEEYAIAFEIMNFCICIDLPSYLCNIFLYIVTLHLFSVHLQKTLKR